MKTTSLVYCAIALAALTSSTIAQTPKVSTTGVHRHFGSTRPDSVDIPEFSMVEVLLEANVKREKSVTSRDKRYDAFIVSDTRLFVFERETKKTFEIKGLPLEWRPLSDLSWANNQTLMFDRWSQPHYGVHYSVNVKTRKLMVAAPFREKE